MKYNTILCACIGLVIWSCTQRQPAQSYQDQIEAHRLEVTTYMNEDESSPFHSSDSVIQLNYFPINEAFKVVANIERIEGGESFSVPTSDGTLRRYRKFAYANFKMRNKPFRLLVLKTEEEGLFLGFTDLTSDESTYGGGRYINLSFEKATQITLDFNLAYNPYCQYTAGYSCPLPPAENELSIAIEAGEKLY